MADKTWRGPDWTLEYEARDTAGLDGDCTEAEILAALEWADARAREQERDAAGDRVEAYRQGVLGDADSVRLRGSFDQRAMFRKLEDAEAAARGDLIRAPAQGGSGDGG